MNISEGVTQCKRDTLLHFFLPINQFILNF